MIRVPEGYCIDTTEVTRSQYMAWADTSPPNPMNAGCEIDATFMPSCSYPSGTDDLPAICVDWCDAHAYCLAAGKRLCGKIGGGPTDYTLFADYSISQWTNACSAHGQNAYPYGSIYEPTTCNGANAGVGAWVAVGTFTGCQSMSSPYAGIFDLSGNVWEWEDACNGSTATSSCRYRGGSYGQGEGSLGCTNGSAVARNTSTVSIGFRCCAD
jgi:formylglycine-generating enzyme required for sulfatase activity